MLGSVVDRDDHNIGFLDGVRSDERGIRNDQLTGPGNPATWLVSLVAISEKCPSRARRRSGKFRPGLDNGSVGDIDRVGHAVERVFEKREAFQFCPLIQKRFAELLLNYRLQKMKAMWLQLSSA